MPTRTQTLTFVPLALILALPAGAQSERAAIHESMLAVAREIARARSAGAPEALLAGLLEHYAELRERVGGDDPANAHWGRGTPALAPSAASAPHFAVGPTCGGASVTTAAFAGTAGPIPSTSLVEFTLPVSGLASRLWDVNLSTSLTHTACQDLDVTLISPAGTAVVITTDNAGINDDCFNGTVWDDNVNDPVTDRVFANLVTATPLSPEGRLAAFRGEDPNGTWRLRVQDDSFSNLGALGAWTLGLSALASSPSLTTTTVSRSPGIAIPDNGLLNDPLPVSGLGTYLANVVLYVEIRHTFCADLDLRLVSPAGTSVVVTTDGGGSFDDVFNGTSFDPDALLPVTDALFANAVVVPLVSPEGSFDNFLGQDPNGTWTLSVADDTATNVGTLERWDLRLSTATNPNAPAPAVFNGVGGAVPDFGAGPATNFTAQVSGLSGYLWDVDLSTSIVHPACADLDITLTAPSGKQVVVTTDNGFTGGVFNGTLWDDNANDLVADHFYTLNVVATPLSPEGRFSALRGENPNGTWTLTITDDTTTNVGSLSAWSLTLGMTPSAPTSTSASFSSSPNLPIPDAVGGVPGSVSDVINVSGLGSAISKITVYTEIQHTWSDDIDAFLTSPAGTTVPVITDCSGNFDDVFNGTTFDPASTLAPTDYPYVDLVVVPLLAPEGSFDNFLGQDPNGAWTLEVRDDFGNDTGTFVRWDLGVSTCTTVAPLEYCPPVAPGSSSGCLPGISANANPNVAHSGSCVVSVAGVEGLRTGLIFYGTSGALSLPWCTGANTFLCVKPPTQRTPAQSSGGSAGQCDGALTLDWNAFQLANPGALGNPWTAGTQANLQGWFRDPTSCKTTFLSEALQFVYQP